MSIFLAVVEGRLSLPRRGNPTSGGEDNVITKDGRANDLYQCGRDGLFRGNAREREVSGVQT